MGGEMHPKSVFGLWHIISTSYLTSLWGELVPMPGAADLFFSFHGGTRSEKCVQS